MRLWGTNGRLCFFTEKKKEKKESSFFLVFLVTMTWLVLLSVAVYFYLLP